MGALAGDLVDLVCCFLVAFICLGAGVIKISLIISCVKLCRLSLANGKGRICSEVFSVRVVFGFESSKKLSRTEMQINRQMIAAKAPAAGVAGWLGFTTTATTIVAAPVTLPVGGIVAAGALLTYGGYQAYKFLHKKP